MLRIPLYILLLLGFWTNLFASDIPFSDVTNDATYYPWVKLLYDYGVIYDDGSWLFRPNEPINRDTFVWLATSVSCKKCLTPSIEDIVKYNTSPFVDLVKTNANYYCIAYATEKNIVQGYLLGAEKKFTCQDWTEYSSTPFCPKNSTSRIEAAWMLLRQAWLWDDIRNSWYSKKINLSDVSIYWQGYAEKWINAWILQIQEGERIYPDTIITRGEFASMASKILEYNQCKSKKDIDTITSDIIVQQADKKIIKKTVFELWTTDFLWVIWSRWDWNKSWTLINPVTSEVLRWSGEIFPLKDVGAGRWVTKVDLVDRISWEIVSTSTATIVILWTEEKKIQPLSINIDATPLTITLDEAININAIVSWGSPWLSYSWDFWDGTKWTQAWDVTHKFKSTWNYTVTLTVTDKDGNVSQANLVVLVENKKDSDWDGVLDIDDICVSVFGSSESSWCPKIVTANHDKKLKDKLSWFDDGTWSPTWWTPSSSTSLLWSMSKNWCLLKYSTSKWLLIGSPICDTCHCQNKVDILDSMRSCDIIFPTILSVDKSMIFTRGGFYQIP